MKIGLSVYSLYQAIAAGEITPLKAVDLIADYGADNIELVGFVTPITEDLQLLTAIKEKCAQRSLDISAYSVFSDILDNEGDKYEAELKKIYSHIDTAAKVGTKIMRSDFTSWGRSPEINVIENFDRDLPKLIGICQQMADYARPLGITITVENHGTYINNSERVRRLILNVNRDNFRCTLDIGNCLCVDEDPIVCVKNLLPFAATIHFKDFLIRKRGAPDKIKFLVAGWLNTNYGNRIRGTIVGDGDIDTLAIVQYIRSQGYDGSISIEFEGSEECKAASKTSLANLKNFFQTKNF
ncbi:MAG: sugar phosphate isomerase/epimerase [Clostridiales bacterium]|jgi:sugar phosphate isomerase/epimerase|nr:sugar phosphate isomerase/epimerase [Clostridiales bacterium]